MFNGENVMYHSVLYFVSLLSLLPILFAPHLFQVVWQPYMKPVTLSKNDEVFVLRSILGKYQTKCTDYTGSVPEISSVVSGSFTKPNQKEKLYTVHFVDCSPAHYNNYGKTRVYVVRDDKVVFDADSEGVAVKTIDLNYNNWEQWVSEDTVCNQGHCVQSVTIKSIVNGEIIEDHVFDPVYESHCSPIDEEQIVKYTIITALPFEMNYTLVPQPKTKKCDSRD